jgi:hypothetical protein
LVGAASLLWRVQLYGGAQRSPAWDDVARHARTVRPGMPLADVHAALVLVAIGDEAALGPIASSRWFQLLMRVVSQEIGASIGYSSDSTGSATDPRAAGGACMIRALLIDLDGVVREWDPENDRQVEQATGLPIGPFEGRPSRRTCCMPRLLVVSQMTVGAGGSLIASVPSSPGPMLSKPFGDGRFRPER